MAEQIQELTTDVTLQYDKSSVGGFLNETKELLLQLKKNFSNLPDMGGFLKDLQVLSRRFSKLNKTGGELPKIMQTLTKSTADSARTFKNLKNDLPDLGKLAGGYRGATQAAQGLVKQNQRVSKSIKDIIKKYGGMAIAIGVIKTSVGSFAGYQDVLKQMQATMGGTTAQYKILEKTTKEVGQTTRFTAKQAAESALSLIRAGVAAKNVKAALVPLVNLATVSGESMGTLTDQVMRAKSGFGLAESDIEGLADVMFKAASTVSMSVGNIGAAYQKTAGVAKLAGLDFKETAKYIALMSSVAVGEEAGTALRSTIQRLSRAPKEVQESLKQLGVTGGNVSEQLIEMRKSFSHLDDNMKSSVGAKLFGEHMAAMMAIMNASDEEFKRVSDAIDDSNGALAMAKKIMDSSLMGYLKELGSLVGGLAINFGQFLAPAVYLVVQAIKAIIIPLNVLLEFLNSGTWYAKALKIALLALTAAIAWNMFIVKLNTIALFANAMTHGTLEGAIMLTTMAQMKFVSVLGRGLKTLKLFGLGLWNIARATFAMLGPWVTAAIVIVGAGVLIYKNWESLKNMALSLWETLDNNPLGKIFKFWLKWMNPIGQIINALGFLWKLWKKFREDSKDVTVKGSVDTPGDNPTKRPPSNNGGWISGLFSKGNGNSGGDTVNNSKTVNGGTSIVENYTFNTHVADNQATESRQRDDVKTAKSRSRNGWRR